MARCRQESITTVAALQAKVSPITKHTPGGSTLQAPSKTQQETLLDDVRLQANSSKKDRQSYNGSSAKQKAHTQAKKVQAERLPKTKTSTSKVHCKLVCLVHAGSLSRTPTRTAGAWRRSLLLALYSVSTVEAGQKTSPCPSAKQRSFRNRAACRPTEKICRKQKKQKVQLRTG